MGTSDPVTVFIVEDNENVREAVTGYLRLEGMEVTEFGEISPAEKALARGVPDILILDVMLPDGDGFLLAKRIRERSNVPILFLTARDQESDRITGLELGADDYVVKPFSPKELVLRVKAILRRSTEEESVETGAFRLGESELTISETEHRVISEGREVQLTAAEWNILAYLAERSPQVMSRIQILENCLESIAEGSERTVDTHVKNLRRKLGSQEWIETVRGFGYRFNGRRA